MRTSRSRASRETTDTQGPLADDSCRRRGMTASRLSRSCVARCVIVPQPITAQPAVATPETGASMIGACPPLPIACSRSLPWKAADRVAGTSTTASIMSEGFFDLISAGASGTSRSGSGISPLSRRPNAPLRSGITGREPIECPRAASVTRTRLMVQAGTMKEMAQPALTPAKDEG